MFKLFDSSESVVLPNGKTYTSQELKNLGEYDLLFSVPCVIGVSGGVMYTYMTVGEFANQSGVEEQNTPEETFNVAMKARSANSSQRSTMLSVQKAIRLMAANFTDEQALQVPDLYDEYQVDHAYKKDERFTYNGVLFKVNQDHTSASQWVPGETGTESLYTKIVLNEDGYDVWKQPTGAHDAYNTGDIVEYNGQLYKSLIDGNAYSPDAYPAGWEVYTEE